MQKRAFLIHGWGGHPLRGWHVWLHKQLEGKGFQVFSPFMPDSEHPKKEEWVNHLSKLVKTPTENDYFVGHSLGCITILRYLETLPADTKVAKSILVAPFWGDLNEPDLKTFYESSLDWEKVKKMSKYFCLFSDNDRWVSVENEKVFKEKLGAETLLLQNMGHFSSSEGCNEIPILLPEFNE